MEGEKQKNNTTLMNVKQGPRGPVFCVIANLYLMNWPHSCPSSFSVEIKSQDGTLKGEVGSSRSKGGSDPHRRDCHVAAALRAAPRNDDL
jgi:hypothetical protein